jgi:hypothetical protein
VISPPRSHWYDYSQYAYRLFWGEPSSLKERHVIDATRESDDIQVTFETGTDGASLTAHLHSVPIEDWPDGAVPLPIGTLEGAGRHETLKVRVFDVPTTDGEMAVNGLSFTCF